MLPCCCVKRLLTVLEDNPRPNRKVKTAVYCSKTADIDGLGHYVKQYLTDESYISRNQYWFDYSDENVYIDKSDDHKMFDYVIAQNYEIIFMIVGDDEDELTDTINQLPDSNNTVFVPIDCKLRSYRFLDVYNKPRQLKRKASF